MRTYHSLSKERLGHTPRRHEVRTQPPQIQPSRNVYTRNSSPHLPRVLPGSRAVPQAMHPPARKQGVICFTYGHPRWQLPDHWIPLIWGGGAKVKKKTSPRIKDTAKSL
jgi:hypothetical protein